jgi:hypothetical protein
MVSRLPLGSEVILASNAKKRIAAATIVGPKDGERLKQPGKGPARWSKDGEQFTR